MTLHKLATHAVSALLLTLGCACSDEPTVGPATSNGAVTGVEAGAPAPGMASDAGGATASPIVDAQQTRPQPVTDADGKGSTSVDAKVPSAQPDGGQCTRDADCSGNYCSGGSCVAGVACAARAVTCASARPTCPPGQTASVEQGCWGACVPSNTCADLDDCAVCGAAEICVRTYYEVSATGPYYRKACAPLPTNCDTKNCSCLGALCQAGTCSKVESDVLCDTSVISR